MISRRDKLLNHPWEQQSYKQHRLKVCHAKPAVDVAPPATYKHVAVKPKKLQSEKERQRRIEVENMRLLQRLGDIMRSKRMENLWLHPRPNFLHKEKLFNTSRPCRDSPEVVAASAASSFQTSSERSVAGSKSARSRRCPTCSGNPERAEVKIPEDRVPWQPPPKSWNCKIRGLKPPDGFRNEHQKLLYEFE